MDIGIWNHLQVERSGGEQLRASSVEEAAQQFEALFVAQLLKVMRESVESSGLFGEGFAGKDIHLEMMDQELARELVRRGGFGLAEQIQSYLEEAQQGRAEEAGGSVRNPDPSHSPTPSPQPEERKSLKSWGRMR